MAEFYYTNALFPGVGLTFSLCSLSTVAQAGRPKETCMDLKTTTYNLSKMCDKWPN